MAVATEISAVVLIIAGIAIIAMPNLIAYLVGGALVFKGILDIAEIMGKR